MTSVYRIRTTWTGFVGSPGYTSLSFQGLLTDSDRNAAGAAVRTFFASFTTYMSSAWTLTVDPVVQGYDMATGILTEQTTMTTPPAALLGTATPAAFAGGSGAAITWKTSLIFAGRRVTGRTFLVPLQGCYEADGSLLAAFLTTAGTAADALINSASADFSIWHKTMSKPTDGTKPVQIGGAIASATSRLIKDQASQLRSRRT